MADYSWEWLRYPHGNQELVEKTTDASLEQIADEAESGAARFVLTLKTGKAERSHWLIVLDDKGEHESWFEALTARANEVLDNPDGFEQTSY